MPRVVTGVVDCARLTASRPVGGATEVLVALGEMERLGLFRHLEYVAIETVVRLRAVRGGKQRPYR